jgi:MFS transporter, FHS family, L-fucose permease
MARNRYMVVRVFLTFFVMSLVTNILGPIVPDIISSFHVSLTAAGFLAFAFYDWVPMGTGDRRLGWPV